MTNYLITGGAGFIGSDLARYLIQKGNTVTIIDNLSTGFMENIPNEAKFIEGCCQDQKIYSSLIKKRFDTIYHIAGQSSGETSFDDPVYDLQTNTQSTLLLLKYARDTGCNRFLYASSMSVYGDQPDMAIAEDRPCKPKSFYGVGKMASEHYMNIYQKYNINCTALRLFNVYGPGQNMDNLKQGMISIYLAQAVKNKRIIIKGSHDRFRDFIYIDDVVNAFVECEKNPNSFGSVYNVATGEKTTVGTLLEMITEVFSRKIPIEFQGNTPGDQFGIYADVELIKKEIGWKPQYPLDLGLHKMIQSILENE